MKRLIDLPENMQAALEVADSASGLLCPECEGGQTRERSLSIARSGAFIVWRCWRDSCGWRGRAVAGGGEYADVAGPRQTGFKPKPYMAPLWQLSDVEAREIERRYGVYPETLARFGVRVNDHGDLYLPVRGPRGSERGGVLRPKAPYGPKAISYKTADEPWQAWYSDRAQRDPIVIVEDQLSAMRAWQLGFRSVALLGTNLSPEKLDEIRQATDAHYAILALDNDAFDTAVGYVREYAGTFNLLPVLLQKDFKDSTDKEILKVLEVAVT